MSPVMAVVLRVVFLPTAPPSLRVRAVRESPDAAAARQASQLLAASRLQRAARRWHSAIAWRFQSSAHPVHDARPTPVVSLDRSHAYDGRHQSATLMLQRAWRCRLLRGLGRARRSSIDETPSKISREADEFHEAHDEENMRYWLAACRAAIKNKARNKDKGTKLHLDEPVDSEDGELSSSGRDFELLDETDDCSDTADVDVEEFSFSALPPSLQTLMCFSAMLPRNTVKHEGADDQFNLDASDWRLAWQGSCKAEHLLTQQCAERSPAFVANVGHHLARGGRVVKGAWVDSIQNPDPLQAHSQFTPCYLTQAAYRTTAVEDVPLAVLALPKKGRASTSIPTRCASARLSTRSLAPVSTKKLISTPLISAVT